MWNFLEKAVQDLTEIVAPITNTNQLFLAISGYVHRDVIPCANMCWQYDISLIMHV